MGMMGFDRELQYYAQVEDWNTLKTSKNCEVQTTTLRQLTLK